MIQVSLRNEDHVHQLTFPCREREIADALIALHSGNELTKGVFVSQMIEPEELNVLENQFVDLDELNYLAKRMQSFFGEVEFSQFYEALKHEGFTEMKDIINLTFNMNRYPLIQDISDVAKIGREYLFVTQGALPTGDLDNPRYAEKGRELIQSGKGIFTEHGMLFVEEETPFHELYDGEVFPFYLSDSDYAITVILEYNDRQELVALPCEEIAIHKASKRLKAPNIDSLTLKLDGASFHDSEWMERFEDILQEQGISETNLLTLAILNNDMDLNKLSALVNYANVEEARDMIKLIENEECFHFFERCEDFEAVAKKFIADDPEEYSVSDALEDYINYEQFGEDMDRDHDGKFVREGYVCMANGECLENILGHREQAAGISM